MPRRAMTCHPLRTTLSAALACAIAGLLLLAPMAWGASTKAPPGNAGVQEYVESIPDGQGHHVATNLFHGRNAALENPGSVLGEQTRQALADDGGRNAAALAEAGAPDRASSSDDGDGGSSPLAAAVRRLGAADGPGGMGAVLPLLLMLLLGAAAGYELRRRHAAS